MERTTRAELARDEELEHFFVDTAAQTRLCELLRAELDVSVPLPPISSLKRHVTEELSEEVGKLRLLSGSTPVDISYVRGQLGPSIPRARSIEDDDIEASQRHQRAIECAIDTTVFMHHAPLSNSQERTSTVSTERAALPRDIYFSRNPVNPLATLIVVHTSDADLFPKHPCKFPIISADKRPIPLSLKKGSARRRKRRGTSTPPKRVEVSAARFYSPPLTAGGKSQGYAMGWRVGERPSDGKYLRSKMSKAVMADP